MGPAAPGLSPAPRRRLPQAWPAALTQGQGRSRTGKRYGDVWLAGGDVETRRAEARQGILVLLGAPPDGHTARGGLWAGSRESEQAWQERGLDRQSRGLAPGPALAMGAGALGFGQALRHVDGPTRGPRCWVQKTAHGLDKLPQARQAQATQRLQALWMAPDRPRAEMAVDVVVAAEDATYPQAAAWLAPDREG